ncbi:unnamed protein product [Prorocentrum cordatum]|uniref:Nuclease associated modular domain-containing protein n=1 Tax=Prorocentrum cordatum TaxID=2364126 RepID=A0ABN9XA45_9DINO|nr:unnamed protein product [Polarella glacialis]
MMIQPCVFTIRRAALSCAHRWPYYRKDAPCGGGQLSSLFCSLVSSWRGPPSGPTFSEALEALAAYRTQAEAGPLARHYTYALRGSQTGLWYIGSRTCPNSVSSPEADTRYMGSSSDSQFKQERMHKLILTKHDTRADAIEAECFFHAFYNVAANCAFANRARQTSIGFNRQGVQLSEGTKRKMSESKRGRTHSEETKNKMRGRTVSEETKRKMSEAKRGDRNPFFGRCHSEEARKKMSETLRGRIFSEEAKRRMSEAKRGDRHPLFGRSHSEETRRKMSESQRGRTHSEETKKKMRGRTVSEEAKRKMSEARRGDRNPFFGKSHSEETKKQISKTLRGRTLSEETKKKISETLRRRTFSEETKQTMRGRTFSEETKRKMSEAKSGDRHPLFGRSHSEETKQHISKTLRGRTRSEEETKISETLRGRTFSEETKRHMNEAKSGDRHPFSGKSHSEEKRETMSESKRGRTRSEETKKKISESLRGRTFSEETKRNMSEAKRGGRHLLSGRATVRRQRKHERDPARKDVQRGGEAKDERG